MTVCTGKTDGSQAGEAGGTNSPRKDLWLEEARLGGGNQAPRVECGPRASGMTCEAGQGRRCKTIQSLQCRFLKDFFFAVWQTVGVQTKVNTTGTHSENTPPMRSDAGRSRLGAVLGEISGQSQKISRKQNQEALGMAVGDKPLPLHPHWPARQCWAHLTWRTVPNPRGLSHFPAPDGL